MHTLPLTPLLLINRPDDDYLTLYILWLRMIPVHEYLKTLLLRRKIIKFRCKKKTRRENTDKDRPIPTERGDEHQVLCT